jgi:hypothetical protein
MIINGVELKDIDIFDLETAENYEKALEKVSNEAKDTEGLNTSAAIKKQCRAVFDCFNTIFGADTDKKVFGDKINLLICLKAFEDLVEYTKEQNKELEKITNKYSSNRAQRRVKK